MWLCLNCMKFSGKSPEDATLKDAKDRIIPNVIKCDKCGENRVCVWFGKKGQPIRL